MSTTTDAGPARAVLRRSAVRDHIGAVGTIAELELKQRVRSVAWYVLLGVFAGLLLVVTVLLLLFTGVSGRASGRIAFSTIVFFVLLLGSLVTPALSGGAINGDRDAGTLATTQVTLVTSWQLLLGKFLAAWTAALAFLAVAVPFLLVAVVVTGVGLDVIVVSLLVTVVELGVIAAIGVGLSSIIPRPIFSVVATYLVVAALSIGTLIAFGLGGAVTQVKVTNTYQSYAENAYNSKGDLVNPVCDPPQVAPASVPRFDTVWWLLAANPYVVLADAVPSHFDTNGNPVDLFGGIQSGVRAAQIAPRRATYHSDCHPSRNTDEERTAQQIVARTVPGWFVGLALHLLIAAALLLAGLRALRTPARRLPRGSRIA